MKKYLRIRKGFLNPEFKAQIKCIYFLIMNREIIYIGQTTSLALRISNHKCYYGDSFNKVRFIECPEKHLSKYEQRWIKKFKPRFNMILYDGTWGQRFSAGYNPRTAKKTKRIKVS